jgi:hypothetical protein
MDGCSEETIHGLLAIAELGPVIHASRLNPTFNQDTYRYFQGAVTKRTRTITGDKDACLLAWDDWDKSSDGIGHYAVTMTTFHSLRRYFELD